MAKTTDSRKVTFGSRKRGHAKKSYNKHCEDSGQQDYDNPLW